MEKTLREAAWAVYRAENYLNDIAEDETADFSNRHDALIEAWKDLRAALDREADDGWISVEDRLPELQGEYIVAHEQKEGMPLGVSAAEWVHARWFVSGKPLRLMGVTHWMPMPKPPQSRERGA